MNPFRNFPTGAAPVEKSDGASAGPYEFIFAGDTLVTWDVNADLDEGDTILRNLPNGKTQRLEVTEVTFNQQVSRIPAHFLIKYAKRASGGKRMPNQTINIHSAQAVQIGDHNTQQVTAAIQALVQKIESGEGSKEEKAEALGMLQRFLAHPLVAAAVGAAISLGA